MVNCIFLCNVCHAIKLTKIQSEALPKRSCGKCHGTHSVLACSGQKSQKNRHLGKTRTRAHLMLKTMISHTARLISVSVAHSLLQFKSANGGLQCLCSAAHTWHQICPPGTHYCLQETSTHPLQNRPHTIIVFPGLCRAILYHILSLEYKDVASAAVAKAMVAGGDQFQTGTTPPSAALHWRAQQQTAPSSSPLLTFLGTQKCTSSHSFDPTQLTGNSASENSSYTARGLIQGKWDGQHTQPLPKVKIYSQPERSWFFPTQMRLSVPWWGNEVMWH